ncbi:MAG: hypothetical protein KatS3mg105_5198 [Gemmatales bacterium]|nr:MAG: hypothetical protein KatS3mg105_5198 [Gemmatales bacterium]
MGHTVSRAQAVRLGDTKGDLSGRWWRVNNDALVAPFAGKTLLYPLPPPAGGDGRVRGDTELANPLTPALSP